jgi:hypothetical protein
MDRTQELEFIKSLIKKHYKQAECGLFKSKNIFGDPMFHLYKGIYFELDICYRYEYFVVLGTTTMEFNELAVFYEKLGNKKGVEV